jgi:hypothetical protein
VREILLLRANYYAQQIKQMASTEPLSWLAARLNDGDMADAQLVRDCEAKLISLEGFATESDFAEAEDVDAAYLRSIGITGKGIQNRLLKLHRALRAELK